MPTLGYCDLISQNTLDEALSSYIVVVSLQLSGSWASVIITFQQLLPQARDGACLTSFWT